MHLDINPENFVYAISKTYSINGERRYKPVLKLIDFEGAILDAEIDGAGGQLLTHGKGVVGTFGYGSAILLLILTIFTHQL